MSVGTLSGAIVVAVMMVAEGGRASYSGTMPPLAEPEECNRVAQMKLNPLSTEAGAAEPSAFRSLWARRKPPPPAAATPDPADESMRGMSEVGYKNEHYRRAYRECMKERAVGERAARN